MHLNLCKVFTRYYFTERSLNQNNQLYDIIHSATNLTYVTEIEIEIEESDILIMT